MTWFSMRIGSRQVLREPMYLQDGAIFIGRDGAGFELTIPFGCLLSGDDIEILQMGPAEVQIHAGSSIRFQLTLAKEGDELVVLLTDGEDSFDPHVATIADVLGEEALFSIRHALRMQALETL